MKATAFVAAAVCVVAAASAHAAASKWTIAQIGGPGFIFAESVNNRGDVSGRLFAPGLSVQHAFVWSNGMLTDLGVAPGDSGSDAIAINNGGAIVANNTSNAGPVSLFQNGTWLATGVRGQAFAINESGAFTGGFLSPRGFHAFIDKDGTFTDIGTLGGGVTAFGRGINNRGDVVGFSGLAGTADLHAFLFRDGAMTDLGTLGGHDSWAMAINNAGTIVGAALDTAGHERATVWDSAGIRPIVTTGGFSIALAINDRGQVVGSMDSGSFLFEDGVVTRLESIPEVAAAGWTRMQPSGINDRGWIAGFGTRNGQEASFVLMPR